MRSHCCYDRLCSSNGQRINFRATGKVSIRVGVMQIVLPVTAKMAGGALRCRYRLLFNRRGSDLRISEHERRILSRKSRTLFSYTQSDV